MVRKDHGYQHLLPQYFQKFRAFFPRRPAVCQDCVVNGKLFTTQSRLLTTLKKKPIENIVGKKEKMLVTSIFSFCHNVFYQSQRELLFLSSIYFVVCKCFQFGPVKKFVIWNRVNT